MMMKTGKKRKGLIIVICVIAVLMIFGAICVTGLIRYESHVPKLTVKEQMEVPCGARIPWKELVSVECEGDYSVRLMITDTNISTAKILQEKDQELYVGEEIGYIRLSVTAAGEVAEYVQEETIVYVKPDAKEEEEILKESADKFEEIRVWLSEHDFAGDKEFSDETLVTQYHLDPVKRIGYAEYFLSRKDHDGEEKYYRIFAEYEPVISESSLRLKDVLAKEVDREAFSVAKNQADKVTLIKGQQ